MIVGHTRFTRDDFLNARRSLPGARAPLALLPMALVFTLFGYFASREGGVSASILMTPIVFCLVFVFVVWNGTRRWADNVFTELRGDRDVTFRFDRYGLAVETSKRQAKMAWEVLHRALPTKFAFLVYTSPNTLEVVPKRAFAAEDLETLRRWLRQRVRTRPAPRMFRKVILLWAVLIVVFLLIWQFLDPAH